MPTVFNGVTAEQAANGDSNLLRFLQGVGQTLQTVQTATATTTTSVTTLATQIAATVPAASSSTTSSSSTTTTTTPAGITVSAADGNYTVKLTAPSDAKATVYYQLQSCPTLDFDNTHGVDSYGGDHGSSQTTWLIADPNVTKFFRFRYRTSTTWSSWTYYYSASVCGPISVYSGLITSTSSSLVNTACTPTGSNPLTQLGKSTTINVASSVWTSGNQTLYYNAGSVDPGSYGTWLIYAIDLQRKGGTVTYYATQNSSDITSSLGAIYFGKITTASLGGGYGDGGGGGTCCRAGVPYRGFDGTDRDCSTLQVGDELMGADGGKEIIQRIVIQPDRPCFHLEFDDTGVLTKKELLGDFTVYQIELDRSHTFLAGSGNVIDGACSTHTIQRFNGGFCNVFSAVVGERFSLINGAIGSHNMLKA